MNVYCHADAAEQAQWFGDDISFKGDGVRDARHEHGADDRVPAAPGRLARQRRGAGPAAGGVPGGRAEADGRLPDDALHAGRAVRRADRPGRRGLRRDPAGLRAVGRQGPSRTICAARRSACRPGWCSWPARSRSFSRRHGIEAAVAIARRHRGTQFDPAVVDLFCDHAPELLDGLDEAARLGRRPRRRAAAVPPRRRRRPGRGARGDGRPGRPEVARTSPATRAAWPTWRPRRRGCLGCPTRTCRPLRRAGADPRPRPARVSPTRSGTSPARSPRPSRSGSGCTRT